MEGRIDMSQHERDVLVVMKGVLQGERRQQEAGRLLRLSERQVRRIQRRLEAEGDGAVVHHLRGRSSNRQLNVKLREQIQLHKPAWPGLRQGRAVVEQRLDGSLAIRFGDRYLSYTDLGPLPPKLGGSSQPRQQSGSDESQAAAEPRSSTVPLTKDCSGHTGTEPDPVASTTANTPRAPYRPPTTRPWRRKFLGPTPTS
ncbi:MAG: helix-turn-helix domain-containing protein [Isosphaeraceae bacterium]